jgi:glycosyltransferase involved in cell wall biosynthesis
MVIQTFYPRIGGAEKQCLQLSKALQERGVSVKVFTERWKGLSAYEEIEGVPVKRLGRGGPRLIHSILFMISVTFYLIVKSKNYQVIHCHMASSHAIAAALVGKLLRKRVFVLLAGGNAIGEIALSKKTAAGRLKIRALGILKPHFLILNEDQKSLLKGYGLETAPVTQVGNGVNTDVYFPLSADEKTRLRKKLDWSGFIFLYVGRFDSDKITLPVFENFLTGWKAAIEGRKGIFFYLVGAGPLEADYQKIIRRRELTDSVQLIKARDNVSELYQAADVFVLPTIGEGLSNSLLEALASCLPVIVSRVPGNDEFIKENIHGHLFNPFSSEEIKKVLVQTVDNPESFERFSANGRKTALQYSMTVAVDRYLSLYAE